MIADLQNADLNSLLDSLAEETEKYTKALTSGLIEDAHIASLNMEVLMTEIKARKTAKL